MDKFPQEAKPKTKADRKPKLLREFSPREAGVKEKVSESGEEGELRWECWPLLAVQSCQLLDLSGVSATYDVVHIILYELLRLRTVLGKGESDSHLSTI